MLFDTAYDVARVAAMSLMAYAWLVAVLRISGKRTLAKMNAFDLVVTVALGSTLATIVLSSRVAFAEGALAFVMLSGLQFVVAWSSSRVHAIERLVKSQPTLVVRDGEILAEPMRDERLTAAEVHQAARSSGAGSIRQVAAMVLETDGSLSVVSTSQLGDGGALRDVRGYERAADRQPTDPR